MGVSSIVSALCFPSSLVYAFDMIQDSIDIRYAFDMIQDSIDISIMNSTLYPSTQERIRFSTFNWNTASTVPPEWREKIDLLVASDVMYMSRACKPLLDLVDKCLSNKGVAVFVDPMRGNHQDMMDIIESSYSTCLECQSFHFKDISIELPNVIVLIVWRTTCAQDIPDKTMQGQQQQDGLLKAFQEQLTKSQVCIPRAIN